MPTKPKIRRHFAGLHKGYANSPGAGTPIGAGGQD